MQRAEAVLGTSDLTGDLGFFKEMGFRLDAIWPADDPAVARMSGLGTAVRLVAGQGAGTLRLLTDDAAMLGAGRRISPGGTVVEPDALTPQVEMPETLHSFVVRRLRDEAPWAIGRAGMHYRDLVPDRLGGAIIASHIRIPDGGPVPDMVHFHTVGFQLIFCYRGWVDLVYEDQGAPFRLTAGSCVIQPPRIRHRVLYASPDIEVIEIGVPAEHVTSIDHEMELPNGPVRPERRWDGQAFVHHRAEAAEWGDFRIPGLVSRDTGIGAGTGGVAGVHVVRRGQGGGAGSATLPATSHGTDILFTFVMEGRVRLEGEGRSFDLEAGDAFAIPPGAVTRYVEPSEDLELLEVSLPAEVPTEIR